MGIKIFVDVYIADKLMPVPLQLTHKSAGDLAESGPSVVPTRETVNPVCTFLPVF
jgi:hypothetical protein